MSRTVADQFADTLVAAGVKRVYGVVGDWMEVGIWAGDPSGLEVCWVRHALVEVLDG